MIILTSAAVVGIVLLIWMLTLAPASSSSSNGGGAVAVRADSPARLYNVVGGKADIWWNDTHVTNGPDTVNPKTGRPFEIRHIRNITFKAIDIPIRVDVRVDIVTYSKLRVHRDLNDLHHVVHSHSKKAVESFEIAERTNYYTLETVTVVSK